ncbi:hypothetical protein G7Y89_g11643 [Cudoniella acicularis]|uniref:Uncharacterized protein n=1 Tax=Cudoniella acicularis TaxID=354080 RepID=A0A8H4RD32_9HELO|nr:hypothetical protein G7Y89_g11643 [Cudoniella acicularis]
MSLTFDPNTWYSLSFATGSPSSLFGIPFYKTSLSGYQTGAVVMNNTDHTSPYQHWQIFPYDATYSILRSKSAGPTGLLTVELNPDNSSPTADWLTMPIILGTTVEDEGTLWQFLPCDDDEGSFYLVNKVNGTGWHMQVYINRVWLVMSPNVSWPQPDQAYVSSALGAIDDVLYSSVPTDSFGQGLSTTLGLQPSTAAASSSTVQPLTTTSIAFPPTVSSSSTTLATPLPSSSNSNSSSSLLTPPISPTTSILQPTNTSSLNFPTTTILQPSNITSPSNGPSITSTAPIVPATTHPTPSTPPLSTTIGLHLGIGIAFFLLASYIIFFLFFRRRRCLLSEKKEIAKPSSDTTPGSEFVAPDDTTVAENAFEMDAVKHFYPRELDAHRPAAEVPAFGMRGGRGNGREGLEGG